MSTKIFQRTVLRAAGTSIAVEMVFVPIGFVPHGMGPPRPVDLRRTSGPVRSAREQGRMINRFEPQSSPNCTQYAILCDTVENQCELRPEIWVSEPPNMVLVSLLGVGW